MGILWEQGRKDRCCGEEKHRRTERTWRRRGWDGKRREAGGRRAWEEERGASCQPLGMARKAGVKSFCERYQLLETSCVGWVDQFLKHTHTLAYARVRTHHALVSRRGPWATVPFKVCWMYSCLGLFSCCWLLEWVTNKTRQIRQAGVHRSGCNRVVYLRDSCGAGCANPPKTTSSKSKEAANICWDETVVLTRQKIDFPNLVINQTVKSDNYVRLSHFPV